MKQLKQSYIDGYKVTMYKLERPVYGGYYLVSLTLGEESIYKDGLTLDGANYLFFQYIKDGVQIADEFKN